MPSAVDARTYFVAPEGSDIALGSRAAPLATPTRALELADGGDRVVLSAGQYPTLVDQRARHAWTSVGPALGAKVTLAGVELRGSQRLRLNGVAIRGLVTVSERSGRGAIQRAEHLRLADLDISATPGDSETAGSCVTIRGGTRDIVLRDSHVHRCWGGIWGAPTDTRSLAVRIENNVIEDVSPDGIQFGAWDQVRIRRNVIRFMDNRGTETHTDGIQITGNARDVVIEQNEIRDSRHGQLVFLQPAFGPVDKVTVRNNVIDGSMGINVQALGVSGFRFVNNTSVNGYFGALRIGPNDASFVPHDAIVANNVLDGLDYAGGATPAVQASNALLAISPWAVRFAAKSDLQVPAFELGESYRPLAVSPLRDTGDARYAPPADRYGAKRPSTPTIGAVEG